MLDVHPPHEPVHGWRDFAVHLLTITVGLLIALGLEAMVEAVHHHELAAQARENIERELDRNVAHAKANTAKLQSAVDAIDGVLVAVRERRDHPDATERIDPRVGASWDNFEDAAWLTARESGALSHMPLDEVQKYAGVYARQTELEHRADAIMDGATLTLAPLFAEAPAAQIPAENARTILSRAADVKVQLMVFKQIVQGLGDDYELARGHAPPAAATAASSSAVHRP